MALEIKALRVLPSLAIARLGSSATPMDNYELSPNDATGFREVVPAATLHVDAVTGQITSDAAPAQVAFRDSGGSIRPVAPFFEVWAQFETDGPLQPLTTSHLQELGLNESDVTWIVRVGNIKAFRRTGNPRDQIVARTGEFNDHDPKQLKGRSQNFKNNTDFIDFGSARYLRPNNTFPQIRLRITPATGNVYGPDVDNVITAGRDVYNATAAGATWKGHVDGVSGSPPFTNPGGIYANLGNGVSLGYLDDSCDGVVEVKIDAGGQTFSSISRISVGPPDFAPDSLSVRTAADDLEQMLLGPDIDGPVDAEEVIDIVRRALECIQLMSTDSQNIGGMASHDSRQGRAAEPIFQPRSNARYSRVRGIHFSILSSLQGLFAAAGSPARLAAVGALQGALNRLREFDKVGDLTDSGRGKMPAMMRNSDGLHLALTRRQRNKIAKAIVQFGQTQITPTAPEQNMLTLIATLSFASGLHDIIPVGDGRNVSELFQDPPQLLNYLKTANAKGDESGAQLGNTLVVPGNPNESAFFALINDPNHPMHGPFSNSVPSLSKTGIEIAKEWIESLT